VKHLIKLGLDNCSAGIQQVHKILKNPLINSVDTLTLNMIEFGIFSKMTPRFCKSLCEFIESSVVEKLELFKFSLYSHQLNAILKACRNLKTISFANINLLDEEPLRMAPFKTYYQTHKNLMQVRTYLFNHL